MRSLLFVPGDSQRKLDKALESGADALILDLEDSVAPGAKPDAREAAASFLRRWAVRTDRPRLYVRVNAFDSGLLDGDLAAIVPACPDGIMLPKAETGADIAILDSRIAVVEAMNELAEDAITIIAITTETAGSLFNLNSFQGASRRLAGLTWGAEDLSADVGAASNRDSQGRLTDLYRLARSLCLAGATSSGVMPIDTVFTDFRNNHRLREECREAVRDGFAAKMAIHPIQVPAINEEFTPSEAAMDNAKAVLLAFAEAGEAGVTSLDGRMIDRPHMKRAERILARAKAAGLVTS